jgi:hypothetical protein
MRESDVVHLSVPAAGVRQGLRHCTPAASLCLNFLMTTQEDVDRMEAAKPDDWPTYTGGLTDDASPGWRICSSFACFVKKTACVSGQLPRHAGADAPDRKTKRIRVVVVGSGWGAMSFIKAMRKDDAQVQGSQLPWVSTMRDQSSKRRGPSHAWLLSRHAGLLTFHVLTLQRYDVTLISPRNYFL